MLVRLCVVLLMCVAAVASVPTHGRFVHSRGSKAAHDDVFRELEELRAQISALEADTPPDADVEKLTKLLVWYMKKQMVAQVMQNFANRQTGMITEESFDEMITEAGNLVDEHKKDCKDASKYCHEASKGINRASDISWTIWAARKAGMVKGAVLEIFAEKAGMKGAEELDEAQFSKALNNMERTDAEEIAALLQYFFKYQIVQAIYYRHSNAHFEDGQNEEYSLDDAGFSQLITDADTLVDFNQDECAKKKIVKSGAISWKMWIGRGLGMVGPEVKKSFGEGSAEQCKKAESLSKDCFFDFLLNQK